MYHRSKYRRLPSLIAAGTYISRPESTGKYPHFRQVSTHSAMSTKSSVVRATWSGEKSLISRLINSNELDPPQRQKEHSEQEPSVTPALDVRFAVGALAVPDG